MGKILGFGLMGLFVFSPPFIPTAAGKTLDCRFEVAKEDFSPSSPATATAEEGGLTARKNLLREVVGCALKDALTLTGTLEDAPLRTVDFELQEAKNLFLEQLEGVIARYQIQKTKIEDIDEVIASKEFAKDLREWRQKISLPLIEKILNFMIWLKNEELVKTAERRLAHIERTLAVIEPTNAEIRGLFEEAAANLQYARISHRRARQLFVTVNPPDDFPYLMRASLESLARVYQNFFDLGEEVRRFSQPSR